MSSALSILRPFKVFEQASMAEVQEAIIDTQTFETVGLQVGWTSDTIAADTALGGVASSLVIQDITYTAGVRGVAGDDIEIAYVDGVALSVAVVGTVITVTLETGVSTATLVKAVIDGSVAASALVSCAITGTAGDVQVAEAQAPLAGGIDSDVDVTDDTITLTGHAFVTGLRVAASSTGTLPAPLAATNYFVIVVDENTIQLASTLANATAGTAIGLTDQGSSGATITLTPGTNAGVLSVLGSNDYNPHTEGGTFYAITFTPALTQPANNSGGYLVGLTWYWAWLKVLYTPTTGSGSLDVCVFGRGT